jgi:hypothetical protein
VIFILSGNVIVSCDEYLEHMGTINIISSACYYICYDFNHKLDPLGNLKIRGLLRFY